MDNLTRQIADFAADLKYDQLPAQVVAAGTRSLVDALACAIGAHDCEPARMGLRLARGALLPIEGHSRRRDGSVRFAQAFQLRARADSIAGRRLV